MKTERLFDDLAEALRAEKIRFGVAEHLALRRLLQLYTGTDPEELRDAIAAIVSSSAEEVARVRIIFDQLYLSEMKVENPPPPPPPPHLLAILVAVLVAGLAIFAVLRWRPVTAVATTPDAGVVADAGHTDPVPALPEQAMAFVPSEQLTFAAPILHRGWGLLLLIIASLVVLTILGLMRDAEEARSRLTKERNELDRLRGRRHWEKRPLDPLPPAKLLARIAALLTQRQDLGEDLSRVDVSATIARTIEAGLYPVVIRPKRRARQVFVVLVDETPSMRAWHEEVSQLLTELERRGVLLSRWAIRDSLDRIHPGDGGEAVPVARFHRLTGDSPLLVVSAGAVPRRLAGELTLLSPDEVEDRLRTLVAGFGRVAWLNPVADVARWADCIMTLPQKVAVWSMNDAGLLASAYFLSTGEVPLDHAQRAARMQVLSDDLALQLQGLLTLVQHPTLELARVLQRSLFPDASPDLVLVAPVVEAARARGGLTDRLLEARAFFESRDVDGSLRRRALAAIEAQMMKVTPDLQSAAHLRWRRDLALERLWLGGPVVREQAEAELAALAVTPLREEVAAQLFRKDAVPTEDTRQRLARMFEHEVPGWRLRAPTFRLFLTVLFLPALAAAVGELLLGSYEAPHFKMFELRQEGDTLRITGPPWLDGGTLWRSKLTLYADGEPVASNLTAPVVVPLPAGASQLQVGELSNDPFARELAISNALVLVPVDAGRPDAGVPDAGAKDAGLPVDCSKPWPVRSADLEGSPRVRRTQKFATGSALPTDVFEMLENACPLIDGAQPCERNELIDDFRTVQFELLTLELGDGVGFLLRGSEDPEDRKQGFLFDSTGRLLAGEDEGHFDWSYCGKGRLLVLPPEQDVSLSSRDIFINGIRTSEASVSGAVRVEVKNPFYDVPIRVINVPPGKLVTEVLDVVPVYGLVDLRVLPFDAAVELRRLELTSPTSRAGRFQVRGKVAGAATITLEGVPQQVEVPLTIGEVSQRRINLIPGPLRPQRTEVECRGMRASWRGQDPAVLTGVSFDKKAAYRMVATWGGKEKALVYDLPQRLAQAPIQLMPGEELQLCTDGRCVPCDYEDGELSFGPDVSFTIKRMMKTGAAPGVPP